MSCEIGFDLPIRVAGLEEGGSAVDAALGAQSPEWLRDATEPKSWGCPEMKIK